MAATEGQLEISYQLLLAAVPRYGASTVGPINVKKYGAPSIPQEVVVVPQEMVFVETEDGGYYYSDVDMDDSEEEEEEICSDGFPNKKRKAEM